MRRLGCRIWGSGFRLHPICVRLPLVLAFRKFNSDARIQKYCKTLTKHRHRGPRLHTPELEDFDNYSSFVLSAVLQLPFRTPCNLVPRSLGSWTDSS